MIQFLGPDHLILQPCSTNLPLLDFFGTGLDHLFKSLVLPLPLGLLLELLGKSLDSLAQVTQLILFAGQDLVQPQHLLGEHGDLVLVVS